MKIAVFMGGTSSEREVSLRTGAAILNSLVRQGYDAYKVDLTAENLVTAFTDNDYDLAYIALHGEFGEDGRVQALLDMLGKKYTGSGVTPSAVSMDKVLTKLIAEDIGILIPKTYTSVEDIENFPVVVKPAKEGSSVGIYICNNKEEATAAVEALKDKKLLIEEFVKGEELTCGVMNGEAMGVLKITPKSGVYDYTSKYTTGMTDYQFPAQIDSKVYDAVMEASKKIHEELNLGGISRSDFILKDGKAYFLEVNTCPGMTETSLIPKIATLKNYTFDDLTRIMVETFTKIKDN
ncbi:D-alanine--D-alanine ligase [Cetobacterium sp. 2A]|uniref:D-alanine--D-alanine ligase n=1 Tax=Cetobacterium sp. 2A TaxID=2754723 RepID=UPI00163C29A5|nr:D-alanine--D-alanine ligase [Cetobacterium sp. 2A]MBC2856113.1 D-alanine--D-alanine ligase [Cetobacterium sp. 2A]